MAPSVFYNRTPKRIGIVGFYGKGNLGDETVVAILIKKIREHYPNAEISGFSLDPTDTERRHGIKAFPIRWNSDPRITHQEPRLSSISQRVNLFRKLKQRLKKWPVFFKPLKTLKELGLWSCYDLPFFLRSFHRLRGFDLLIVPGSGALTDWWGGPSSHPGTLLSWSVLARLTRTKVIALSIG